MNEESRAVRRGRAAWEHRGAARPDFAVAPGPGEESVWDYPRPPRIEPDDRPVEVRLGGTVVAASRRALRVLETASPPTFYLPPADVADGVLERAAGTSYCEWKGRAVYWHVAAGAVRAEAAAWSYPEPYLDFVDLAGYVSFYPSRVECRVAGERVRAQPGTFYGGWVTDEIVGPFKGEPGTGGW